MDIILRKEAKAKGLKRYYTGLTCNKGHIAERQTTNGGCVICLSHRCSVSRAKNCNKKRDKLTRVKYIERNRESINEKQREHNRLNRDKHNARRRVYRLNNKDAMLKRERKYNAENRDEIRESRREYYRNYMRKKRECPFFKAKTRMRDMLRRVLNKTKCNKNSRSECMLGYTHVNLKNHIEKLFTVGMSWDNLGEWHVDHIKSIKSFLDEGVTDPSVINALSNLQPLWAVDNLRKGA